MITSTKNTQVKQWKKLQTKKGRQQSGTFWIEGFHLIEEAMASDWPLLQIIAGENTPFPDNAQAIPCTTVSEHVFNTLTQTQTPQQIGAVIEQMPPGNLKGNHILLVDAVQDPGNLGTMIRTADAAGFDGVAIGLDSVDVYNDKVIRATQGSLFHVPFIQGDLNQLMANLQTSGFKIWAAALENSVTYTTVKPENKLGLLVGNEGSGISSERLKKADKIVSIPIHGHAESLNVSVAAGILMYYIKK